LKITKLNEQFSSLKTSFDISNETVANFIEHLKKSEIKQNQYKQEFGVKYNDTINEVYLKLNKLSSDQSNQEDTCQQIRLKNKSIENHLSNHQELLTRVMDKNKQLEKLIDSLSLNKVEELRF